MPLLLPQGKASTLRREGNLLWKHHLQASMWAGLQQFLWDESACVSLENSTSHACANLWRVSEVEQVSARTQVAELLWQAVLDREGPHLSNNCFCVPYGCQWRTVGRGNPSQWYLVWVSHFYPNGFTSNAKVAEGCPWSNSDTGHAIVEPCARDIGSASARAEVQRK